MKARAITGSIEDFYDALSDFASETTSGREPDSAAAGNDQHDGSSMLYIQEMTDLWDDQNARSARCRRNQFHCRADGGAESIHCGIMREAGIPQMI